MIVEERIYTIQVGKVFELFKIYEQHGMAAQKRILGNLVGYYVTEMGPLNTLVHMWAYEDLNDRDRRRAQLAADPDFKEYLGKAGPLILRQENRILKPAPFFEAQLKAMLAASK